MRSPLNQVVVTLRPVRVTEALDRMADGMTTANAGRWQITGVSRWRDMILYEDDAAWRAGAGPAMIRGGIADTAKHVGWLATAGQVITVLRARSCEAERQAQDARAAADEKAAERDGLLALADRTMPVTERIAGLGREVQQARAKAAACEAWAAASGEAASFGRNLADHANATHVPVGRAIAAAGGKRWVASDKAFNTARS